MTSVATVVSCSLFVDFVRLAVPAVSLFQRYSIYQR